MTLNNLTPVMLELWRIPGSSKFHVGCRVRQTPEEGQGTYRLKRRGNNNEDEDNSLKYLNP